MSRYMSVAAVAVLVWALGPSSADGVFVKSIPPVDPRAHAPDITEPQQKALIIHSDGIEQLVLQVSFKGDASDFAWIIPTPSRPKVFPVNAPVFHWLGQMTSPRARFFSLPLVLPFSRARGRQSAGSANLDVQVFREETVGVYDVSVLGAGNADDLFQWLRNRKYQVPAALVPLAADYIRRGWVFTAVRVSADRQGTATPKLQQGALQSLKLVFSAPEPIYPLKISSLNSGKTEVLLYVAAENWVEAPGMTADCRLDYLTALNRAGILRTPRNQHRILFDEEAAWKYDIAPPARLTKLRATFTPEQMVADIVLMSNDALREMPPKPLPIPFLATVGMTSLALLSLTVSLLFATLPISLIPLIAATMAMTGRLRWRYWVDWVVYGVFYSVILLVAMMVFVSIGDKDRYLGEDEIGSLVFYGILTLMATGWLLVYLVARIRSRRQVTGP